MDSTFTCISSEELLVVEGGKIKTEDVCYWVGAGVGFGYSCLKLLLFRYLSRKSQDNSATKIQV